MSIDAHGGANALGQIVPIKAKHDGVFRREEGACFHHRIAQQHRDIQRLWCSIRPEGMAADIPHIKHRAHIDTAAKDRVLRRQCSEQIGNRGRRRIDIFAQCREIGLGTPRCILRTGHRHLLPAHRDCFVEQALGGGHRHQGRNLGTTAGLAKDGNILGVTAKRRNISLNPLQR